MLKLVQPFVEFYQVASFSARTDKEPFSRPTAEDLLVLPFALWAARDICRQAIADLRWYTLDEERSRFHCQTPLRSGLWPSPANEFDLSLSDIRPARTAVRVVGTGVARGPIRKILLWRQLKTLTKQINVRSVRVSHLFAAPD